MAQHEESDARTLLRVERQSMENTKPLVKAMTMDNFSLFAGEISPQRHFMVEQRRRRRQCQSTKVVRSSCANPEQHSVRWTALLRESESLPVPRRRRKQSRSKAASAFESRRRVTLSTTTTLWLLLLALAHSPTVRAQSTTTPGKRRKLMMAMKGMKDKNSMCSQFQRVRGL
jgi:hypothetical protein